MLLVSHANGVKMIHDDDIYDAIIFFFISCSKCNVLKIANTMVRHAINLEANLFALTDRALALYLN